MLSSWSESNRDRLPDSFIKQNSGPEDSAGHQRIEQVSYLPLATVHHSVLGCQDSFSVSPVGWTEVWLAGWLVH